MTTAITGDPSAFVRWLTPVGVRGIDALEDLLGAGLTVVERNGAAYPRLAAEVPSIDNGLWVLLPDGRMETSWRIRRGAEWHDGTPFTAEDVLFRAAVEQDRDLPHFANRAYRGVDSVQAPDPYTVTVRWKEPYIEADALFNGPALPKHLLEKPAQENKAGFPQLPYWNDEFVGTGPYKLRQLVRGSHLVLAANDRYVLGRPKIDVVEVRFIPSLTTMAANILAGEVDVTLGKTLSVEQALEVTGQSWDGTTDFGPSNALRIYVQFLNPNPSIITNVQFRRALLHAIDRQQLTDSLLGGMGPVAHSFMFPNQAAYQEIEARLPRYDLDPRKTGQMIEALGYARGTDGVFRDAAGQPLSVESRVEGSDINQKAMATIADSWQRAGLTVSILSVPGAVSNEFQYTFPCFWLRRNSSDSLGLKNLYSSVIPLQENSYRGGNVSRYTSRELDGMLDRYFSTVPMDARVAVLGQVLHHIADQLPELGLFFDAEPTLVSRRLVNVSARFPSASQAWNAHEWDIRS